MATGASDDANGRFATLGWARSFLTRGTASFFVEWEKGKIQSASIMEDGGNRSQGRGRSRPRGR